MKIEAADLDTLVLNHLLTALNFEFSGPNLVRVLEEVKKKKKKNSFDNEKRRDFKKEFRFLFFSLFFS